MTRQIKGFVTCDSFIDNQTNIVSPLYELSDISLTYSRSKQQYYSTEDSLYSLYVFNNTEAGDLSQQESDNVIRVVKEFVVYCSASQHIPQTQMLITFMSNYNLLYPNSQVVDLTMGGLIEALGTTGTDFLHFTVNGIECNIWLNDLSFRGFFPDYEVDIVLPFTTFEQVVSKPSEMIAALAAFSLVEFNTRIERAKGTSPTTHSRIINIPYHLPNSTIKRDCFFAFNQYGSQGNYDYVLKLKLYEYLLSLGLTSAYIETIFPSILQINEFFIVPRWDSYAIPSHVGQNGIRSQVTKAYSEVFNLADYVKVYPDLNYLKNNTYHVPYDYNNILLRVSNGFYTEPEVKDFMTVYDDVISVTSTHPEFSRMKQKTQRFLTLLESMLSIADQPTPSKMFTKMVENKNYVFSLVSRQKVWYLTYFFEGHQYYVLPKYQYELINAAKAVA